MADKVLQSPKNPHFFQPLLPGFHSHLNIPLKFFSEHIEERNDKNTVELRSDACVRTCKVMMEGRKLTIGWKEFATAHDFRIGDVIIFRHDGDLVFHVTGFGPSCCEIDYVQSFNNEGDQDNIKAPYIQDDDDKDYIAKVPRMKHVKKKNHEAETEFFSSDQFCFVAPITHSNLQEDRRYLPRKFVRPDGLEIGSNKIVLMNEELRTWTLNLAFRESSESFSMGFGWRSFCHDNGLKPGDFVKFKLEGNNTSKPILRFSTSESVSKKDSSKRKRETTGESSQRVSSPSSSSLSEKRFVILTITPDGLRRSRACLPMTFTRDNGLENARGKKIIMVDMHGVEWPVSLSIDKKYPRISLGSGFNHFLKATDVKANESILLELVWEDVTSPPMLKFCSKIKT